MLRRDCSVEGVRRGWIGVQANHPEAVFFFLVLFVGLGTCATGFTISLHLNIIVVIK